MKIHLDKIKLIWVLLLVTFFKGILFSIIVPIWQFPDEQAHFSQVQNLAEQGFSPPGNNLSQEIYDSEVLLGTFRDQKGNNDFTYHPDFNIEYTNSTVGKYEKKISQEPLSNRKILTITEATYYPPLFYDFSGLFYRLVYFSDIFGRVYMVRIASILMAVATVYIAYLISKILFPKNSLLQITVPFLVSFQPMFSFVSSGVNSDNLLNLIFSLNLYLGLIIINQGVTYKRIILAGLLLILGYFSKPQFILAIPIDIVAFFLSAFSNPKNNSSQKIIWTVLIIFSVFGIYGVFQYSKFLSSNTSNFNFIQHLKNTLSHTAREVVPWYWGVFKWLGVVLPIQVLRIINRLMILSGAGLLIASFRLIKHRKKIKSHNFIFMIICSAIYFLGITIFDYLYIVSTNGISIGVQGRYFFPVIIFQMTLLLIGFLAFIPLKNLRLKGIVSKVFAMAMLSLNFFVIWLLLKSYYSLNNFFELCNQISQYKPIIFKYPFYLGFLIVYLFLLGLFISKYVHLKYVQDD